VGGGEQQTPPPQAAVPLLAAVTDGRGGPGAEPFAQSLQQAALRVIRGLPLPHVWEPANTNLAKAALQVPSLPDRTRGSPAHGHRDPPVAIRFGPAHVC